MSDEPRTWNDTRQDTVWDTDPSTPISDRLGSTETREADRICECGHPSSEHDVEHVRECSLCGCMCFMDAETREGDER
jgi:hypothetical protein